MAENNLPVEVDRRTRTVERERTTEHGNTVTYLSELDVVTEVRAVECPECGYDRALVERVESSGCIERAECQVCGDIRFPYCDSAEL